MTMTIPITIPRIAAACLILLSACGKSEEEKRAAYQEQQAAEKARVAERLKPYEAAFAKAVKEFPDSADANTAKSCDAASLRKGVGPAGDTRALPLSWNVASHIAGVGGESEGTAKDRYERFLGSGGLDFEGKRSDLTTYQLEQLHERLESVNAAAYVAMIRLHGFRAGVARDDEFIPGSVQGVVAIVEKATGTPLCHASFEATNSESVTYYAYKEHSEKEAHFMKESGVSRDLDGNTKKAIDAAVKQITDGTLTYDADHLLNPAHIVKLE